MTDSVIDHPNVTRTASGGDPTPWLARLMRADGVPSLRREMAGRYPAFTAGRPAAIAILGAAEEGERLIGLCAGLGIRIAMVLDDNPARQGTRISGIDVQPSAALAELDHSIPVVVCSHRLLGAVTRLAQLGFDGVPFAALQVLDPVAFPPHMFYDGLLEDLIENRDHYARLSDSLADATSRAVLDAVIGFRLTLDARLLEPVLDEALYAADCVLPFARDEVYLDGGSYDGDTIRTFIDRVGGSFERVYAFEPDPDTFRRLVLNFAGEPRVVPIPKGLHRAPGELRFADAGGRASLLTEAGGIAVPVTSVDTELKGARASYIKMNIEGAELDALDGACETVRAHAPKLALSAYHRPSDLWGVAAKVLELRSDYRLYLRQHDGGIIETVLYAIPVRHARS